MTKHTRPPLSFVDLSSSLIAILHDDRDAIDASYTQDKWIAHVGSDDRVFVLSPSIEREKALSAFQAFCQNGDCKSVVICTQAITAQSNLIAFHALEQGYRVFLIGLTISNHVTLDALRLTHAGVVVLTRDSFETETGFASAHRDPEAK